MKKSKRSSTRPAATRALQGSPYDPKPGDPVPEAVLELGDTNYLHIIVEPTDDEVKPFKATIYDAGGNPGGDVKAKPGQTITWSCEAGDFVIRFLKMEHGDGSQTHTSPSDRFTYAADAGDDLPIKMRNGIPRRAKSHYEVYVITEEHGVVSSDPRLIWPQ